MGLPKPAKTTNRHRQSNHNHVSPSDDDNHPPNRKTSLAHRFDRCRYQPPIATMPDNHVTGKSEPRQRCGKCDRLAIGSSDPKPLTRNLATYRTTTRTEEKTLRDVFLTIEALCERVFRIYSIDENEQIGFRVRSTLQMDLVR
jgi:hypothetical protein